MRVIIIGGQAGGMTAAARLKRNLPSAEIKVFEKSDYISFGACGLPYFIGGFFTNENFLFARAPDDFRKMGVDVFLKSEVYKVDYENQVVFVRNMEDGSDYEESYDKLLIATGSKARDLPSNIIDSKLRNRIHNLKDLDDAKAIINHIEVGKVKSVAILGAGYIGLELLEAFSKHKDIKVRLIDNKNLLTLNLLDVEFENVLRQEIESHNIDIILKEMVTKIEEKEDKVFIQLESKSLEVDLLITAIGFVPNASFLEDIPLDRLENGALKVNLSGETNLKNIYACGDVVALPHKLTGGHRYIPLATLANKLGRVIADVMVGKKAQLLGVLGSSSIKVLDLEIAKTGLTEFEAITYNIPHKAVFIEDYNHTNYYPNHSKIYAKVIISEDGKRILGATFMGKDGVALRMHAISVAIESKMSPEDLGMLDLGYSPAFTRTWEFLNVLGNVSAK